MIILIIDQNGIIAFESECQSPVTAHRYRPVPGKVTVQRMKPPPRHIHIRRASGRIEPPEL